MAKTKGKIRTIGSTTKKIAYLGRHGQTIGNVEPVFQPLDSPLNEKGRQQAEKLADRASRIPFDVLVSSPLTRTVQTSEPITLATGKSPVFSDLFVERVKPSSLSGKPYTDEAANELWIKWEESLFTPGMRVDDGENFDDLMARSDAALQYLEDRPEARMFVVTHGFFKRVLLARVLFGALLTGPILKAFMFRTHTENTGLSVIKYGTSYEGTGWSLWVYNDHAHLG